MSRATVEKSATGFVLALASGSVEELELSEGQDVELFRRANGIAVSSAFKPKYDLDDMLNNTDPRAFERTEEDWQWLNDPPVGRELL